MQDIIDKTLRKYRKKGKKVEVLKRYLKLRYKMNIDIASIRHRIKMLDERESQGYLLNH